MDLPHNIRELIVGHHRAGKGSREIAKILSVSKSAVNNLVKRFKNFGSVSPTRIGNCGRPRLLSNRDERLVARASVINPTFNARDIRAHVGASIPQVSLRTIQRSLIRRGRLAYRPRKSPDLSPIKRAVRLRWCRKYQNFTDNQWRRTIFSDETYIDLHGSQSTFVRRFCREPVRPCHTVQHRPFLQRLMFWGCICGDGPLALVPMDGTMNAMKYIDTLTTHLVPFLENQPLAQQYVFQQDNAPCHKANTTLTFFRENAIDVIKDWPPYSPDLNIIENIWAFLKMKLRRYSIGTKAELIARVREVWNNEDTKALCGRLAASMRRRIDMCIQHRGGYTKY